MSRPLEGIRILDCGWIIAGPLTTRLLTDFGAEVIKIESHARYDSARANAARLYGPLPDDYNTNPDTGGYFQDVNTGKLSVCFNLTAPEGRELLQRLVAVSDAIVCNLGGDQLDRWGVGYEAARALNPRIIVLKMPAMEGSGPRARWRGFGDHFAALSGLKSISGLPGEPPQGFGFHYPDCSSNPFHAAIALMAALHQRERTGAGQLIELSQYESTAALLGTSFLEYAATGRVPGPEANRSRDAAPHNIYCCRGEDAWCAIAVETEAQWRALCAVGGLEALRRPEYATLKGRRAHEAEIDASIEAWTSAWDRHALAEHLQARGVPAGAYQGSVDLVERDPGMGDRYFERRERPEGHAYLVHGSPLQMRRNPPRVELGPLLGEHTRYVMGSILGMDDAQIDRYEAAGALG